MYNVFYVFLKRIGETEEKQEQNGQMVKCLFYITYSACSIGKGWPAKNFHSLCHLKKKWRDTKRKKGQKSFLNSIKHHVFIVQRYALSC